MAKELFEVFDSSPGERKKSEPPPKTDPELKPKEPTDAPGETEPRGPVITLGYTGVVVALALYALFGMSAFLLGRQAGRRAGPNAGGPARAPVWVILAGRYSASDRRRSSHIRLLTSQPLAGLGVRAMKQKSKDGKLVYILVGPYSGSAQSAKDLRADLKTIRELSAGGRRPFANASIKQRDALE